jgi:LTXXQ motif family protein
MNEQLFDWHFAPSRRLNGCGSGPETVMRLMTIPLLGALALSLTLADPATARPRFGPGMILGAFSVFGVRHAHRHHRYGARARASARARAYARDAARIEAQQVRGKPAAWAGPVFWPHAPDDLFGYAFFPNSGERFWAYGDILNGVFADRAAPPRGRGRAARTRAIQSVAQMDDRATEPPLDLCGSAGGSNAADGVIERIEQTVTSTDAQRALLGQLRAALVAAGDRIKAVCSTEMPATPLQRLDTMQDRIWAIRDAALTMRVPLENFYDALSDGQKARLRGSVVEARTTQSSAERALPNCGGHRTQASDSGAIERLIRPTPEQRVSLQALQMRFAGLAQLVLSACPAETPASPVDRLVAAGERLTTMLFAVMSAGPALQAFYHSLSDEQKASIGKSVRPRAGERNQRTPRLISAGRQGRNSTDPQALKVARK